MFQGIKATLTVGLATGSLALGLPTVSAQGILKGDTGGVGSVNHSFMIVLSTFLQQKECVNLQVNEGQTLTRSALKLGQGRINMSILPPVITPLDEKKWCSLLYIGWHQIKFGRSPARVPVRD